MTTSKDFDRCAFVSCAHNKAYGGGPPELRRCKNGHGPRLDLMSRAGNASVPCGKEFLSGAKDSETTRERM